jgi:hypothetical protein
MQISRIRMTSQPINLPKLRPEVLVQWMHRWVAWNDGSDKRPIPRRFDQPRAERIFCYIPAHPRESIPTPFLLSQHVIVRLMLESDGT